MAPSSVLVVDDDDDIRLLVRTMLDKVGYTVLESATGQGGLEVARSQPVDVILLDLHVPDLDGWSFLIHAWEEAAVKRIPVVMFSASDDEVAVKRAQAWGCSYLAKPFTVEDVVTAIEEALNRG